MSNQFLQNNNQFPYEIFPIEIQMIIEEAENTLNFPTNYLGSAILSASSVAIGNSYKVKVKEGFLTKSNLYVIIVGNAGEVKSHPLSFAFAPIEKKEKESYLNYKTEIENFKSLSEEEKKRTDKPFWKKQILKDFTPESLIKIHSNNFRGVVILVDELYGWIKNFGRYNNSSEQESYLSFWNGSPVSVDRKTDEPIRLDEPFVNIIGTVQTKLLSNLSKDNRGENGFIERFLFALNENPKPVLWTDQEFNKNLLIEYEKLIFRLYSLEADTFKTNIIEFSKDAKLLLFKYQNQCRIKYLNDTLATAIFSKYEVYTARFSLIIQLMHWALAGKSNNIIELFAVENAIKLTEFYFNTAIKINDKISNYNPLDELNVLQQQFYSKLRDEFATSEAIEIAEFLEIPERTIYRLLKNKKIFTNIKHGIYKKTNIKS